MRMSNSVNCVLYFNGAKVIADDEHFEKTGLGIVRFRG